MTESPGDLPMRAAPQASATLSGARLATAAAVIVVAAAAAVRLGAGDLVAGPIDQVPAAEVARRAAFATALVPLKPGEVASADRAAAIAAVGLPIASQAALAADIAAGRSRLVWMSFYDSDAEDGDIIAVSSGGLTQTVRLMKAPIRVALPAPPDGFVRVTGVVDGRGGGVTVGLVTPAGPTPLAVLSVGQSVSVPVSSE